MQKLGTFTVGGVHPTKMEYEGKDYSAVDITCRVPEPLVRALVEGKRIGKIDDISMFIVDAVKSKLKVKRIEVGC